MKAFTYQLPSSLSFDNYAEVEQDILAKLEHETFDAIVLDASNTKYISSAGLRVVLALKKKYGEVSVINASTEVYDIFEMTGFTNLLTVDKAFREVSIEGCKCIGKGAHGTVYSLAPDTIVKVYRDDTSLAEIREEREVSKKAFVLGLPTAIALDIVKVGNQYGTIFELLNSRSCVNYISESKDNMDDYIEKASTLLRKIHQVPLEDGSLPDMKEKTLGYVDKIKDVIDEDTYNRLKEFIKAIPDVKRLLHGDYHLKNQLMVQNGDLMLIDMDTLCVGHPLFEMGQICNAYFEYGFIEPSISVNFLDLPIEKSTYLWQNISRKYYAELDDEAYFKEINKARLIGAIRAVHFLRKHGYGQPLVEKCIDDIHNLLSTL